VMTRPPKAGLAAKVGQHVEPRQADHGLQEDPNVRPDNATHPESIERNQRRRRAALDQHERARSNTPAAPKPSVAGDAQPLSGISETT
jgi:hypothetical protein